VKIGFDESTVEVGKAKHAGESGHHCRFSGTIGSYQAGQAIA
jgi:hypothetical protein